MGSDELFTRKWVEENRMVGKYRHDPAGFTLTDVRRLARAADDLLPMMTARRNLTLAPFADLLKEKNDAT